MKKALGKFASALFSLVVAVPAVAGEYSGSISSTIGNEEIGGNVRYTPMPQIFGGVTKKHDSDFPWKSTTVNIGFETPNEKGRTMFEDGTGLRPREISVALRGIGGCTDFTAGMSEPAFNSASHAWRQNFYEFSPSVLPDEVAFAHGLILRHIIGAGLRHNINCGANGKGYVEGHLLYRAPAQLRTTFGQSVEPPVGLTATSLIPSYRLAAGSETVFDERTILRYGLNVTHLQEGVVDGVRISWPQTSVLASALLEHKFDNGILLRGFAEGGHIRNGNGNPAHSGTYMNASAHAVVPVWQRLSLIFAAFGAKNPSPYNFFGREVAGAEAGFEWPVVKTDSMLVGVTYKHGFYYVWGNEREGVHQGSQALLRLEHRF